MTPRKRCDRSFTQSKNFVAPAPAMSVRRTRRISIQVVFSDSHISEVICQRTACAFSRASRRQL